MLFLQKKCKIFERWRLRPQIPVPPAAESFAPRPPFSSDGWGLRPQTPKTASHCEFLARTWVLRCLLVARKENLTGVSTGLTARSKNLDTTGNPIGRSTRPISISSTGHCKCEELSSFNGVCRRKC